jgi:hypothetical protein
MNPQHDKAFTDLKYSFSELCLADKESAAEQVLGIVRDLGWDYERVERNRPAMIDDGICIGTGESMLLVHLHSGLGYLIDAARELGRLGFRAQRDGCERIIHDCKNSSRG